MNFRVPEELAQEIELQAKTMRLSVSEYLRFLARHEKDVLREIESLKTRLAQVESALFQTNKMAFRAYRYGWFCAMALKEGQIKQVELKIEKELTDYETTLKKEGFNEQR